MQKSTGFSESLCILSQKGLGNAMHSPVTIHLRYSAHPHLSQIYAGFQMLERSGIVTLKWHQGALGAMPGMLSVRLHNRDMPTVHYDILDGLNWIPASEAENLRFFAREAPSGIIFKRAFRSDLRDVARKGTEVRPLGLNYQVSPLYRPSERPVARFDRWVRGSSIGRLVKAQPASCGIEEFEALPELVPSLGVLMITRLWNPKGADVRTRKEVAEREELNAERIESLLALRRKFGNRFLGGIVADPFSNDTAPKELLLPWRATEKRSYLRLVKRHSICVATTGLHGSIGWRVGEYAAAARAIVTEPLRFEVGDFFSADVHYLEASLANMSDALDDLICRPSQVRSMMEANMKYYRTRLKPDALVWHTLVEALEQ